MDSIKSYGWNQVTKEWEVTGLSPRGQREAEVDRAVRAGFLEYWGSVSMAYEGMKTDYRTGYVTGDEIAVVGGAWCDQHAR